MQAKQLEREPIPLTKLAIGYIHVHVVPINVSMHAYTCIQMNVYMQEHGQVHPN